MIAGLNIRKVIKMFSRKSTLLGIIAVVLSLSSLFFLPISLGVNGIENPSIESQDIGEEIITDQGIDKPIDSGTNFSTQDITTNTTGTYKNVAYFIQDNYVNLDENGPVFEWERYEDVKDDAANFDSVMFRVDNGTSQPDIWWHPLDTWGQLRSSTHINGEYINSTTFSPVFNYDTEIQGNVYFMNTGEIWRSLTSSWSLRVKLERFNPNTGQTVLITTASGMFDDTDRNPANNPYSEGNPPPDGIWEGWVYEGVIPNTTIIPAGYRLRATYEAKLTSASFTDTDEKMEVRTGAGWSPAYPVEWNIDSTNDTFDNSYALENNIDSFGIQLYMYKKEFPTIALTGLANNTAYNEAINGTITVSSDSIFNQYKWDSGSFTNFSSPTIVSLPETNGWHTLTVQAYDFFDNIAEANYRMYYDASLNNVLLYSPLNNSLVTDGQLLNFSLAEDVIDSEYEWDKEGVTSNFNPQVDIYPNRGFEGWHNLTVYTTDLIGSYETVFFFEFDNSAPTITLSNVVNLQTYAQGKNIEFTVTDRTDTIVDYFWDSNSWSSLDPIEGDLYRTYLPATAGWHNLTIRANDTFGQLSQEFYRFNTDPNVLLVELYTMVNNSYYYGGNDIEISIVNDNDTVRYFWGSDSPSEVTLLTDLLTLTGADALSTTAGTYTLTIIVFDILDDEYQYTFKFVVDRMKPTVIPDTVYNETRQLTKTTFSFTITDNLTATIDLDIYLSIDNAMNSTFYEPFEYSLKYLDEGLHNLTIWVIDIAGNSYRYFISFTIDETAPSLSVSIIGMAQTPDSSRYVPANAEIIADISDDDPTIYSYYSWDYGSYTEFFGSFFLPATEMYSSLLIKTNDSLGNYRTRTYYLTIDDSAPTIDLSLILNNSKINLETILSFTVEDINDDTIDLITSQWDLSGSDIKDPSFTESLPGIYYVQAETEATISLFMEDIVGNNYSCVFRFNLDFQAPIYSLTNVLNESYVHGNDLLDFDVASVDLLNFYYKWDDDVDYLSLVTPWDLNVPIEDGNHTLYVRLEDDTGGGIYVNFVEDLYVFIVDDIEVTFIDPVEFTDNFYYTMYYGEYFNFSLNIEDAINNTQINELFATIDSSNDIYNLDVNVYNISKIYYCSVDATNVTDGEFTEIIFNFEQFSGNKQTVTVFIRVHKQAGNMILVDIDNVVTYEDDITIQFKLNDYVNLTAQTITHLSVNGSTNNVNYVLVDVPNLVYEITLDTTDFTVGKGSFTFEIYTESAFYFGTWNDTSSIAITIEPIPITLTVDVSGLEIIYDNELVITATLLRADGTPISAQAIVFCFYITYKEGYTGTTTNFGLNSFTVFDQNINETAFSNLDGIASASLGITEDMVEISLLIVYEGNDLYDPLDTPFSNTIYAIAGGLAMKWIIIIIAGSLVIMAIISGLIYRFTKARPFEDLMEDVTEDEIKQFQNEVSPGVLLSIFDQMKGPIPLIGDHVLEEQRYSTRMRIGVENFLLKISDQAYSSLGFEEHDERRRIGSINLPNENMIAFIHGVQLENKLVRGGFENLSLIVLADTKVGGLLLANQEFMFPEIDNLIIALKTKEPLPQIQKHITEIRKRSVIIMLAAKKNVKKDKEDKKEYQ